MSYLAIARKWRPQRFDDVVGQGHVTRTLQNAIRTGRIHHAFLFTGARGVGKTSCARIFAKALSCEQGPTAEPCGVCRTCVEITSGSAVDVIEIDGASNNGVDEVRALRDSVRYLPQKGRRKVYIIDEVHMLSVAAFNALLKTLEEPPAHVLFVLATTEPQKIPETILSRCLRFDFKRIPLRAIVDKLAEICRAEGVEVSEASLLLIAREAEGSMRDSQSLLDQVIAFSGSRVTDDEVVQILGLIDRRLILDLVAALAQRDVRTCLALVDHVFGFGFDLKQLTRDLLEALRNLQVIKVTDGARRLLDIAEDDFERMRGIAEGVSSEVISRLFSILAGEYESIHRAESPRWLLEMTLLRMTQVRPVQDLSQLLTRLSDLEARLGGAAPSASRFTDPAPSPRVEPAAPRVEAAPAAQVPSGSSSRPTPQFGREGGARPAPPATAGPAWGSPRAGGVEPPRATPRPPPEAPPVAPAPPVPPPPQPGPPPAPVEIARPTPPATPTRMVGVEPPPPGGGVGQPGQGRGWREFVLSLPTDNPRRAAFRQAVVLKEGPGELTVAMRASRPIPLDAVRRYAADDVTAGLLARFFDGVMSLLVREMDDEAFDGLGQRSLADEEADARRALRARLRERALSHPRLGQALSLFDVQPSEVEGRFEDEFRG